MHWLLTKDDNVMFTLSLWRRTGANMQQVWNDGSLYMQI